MIPRNKREIFYMYLMDTGLLTDYEVWLDRFSGDSLKILKELKKWNENEKTTIHKTQARS